MLCKWDVREASKEEPDSEPRRADGTSQTVGQACVLGAASGKRGGGLSVMNGHDGGGSRWAPVSCLGCLHLPKCALSWSACALRPLPLHLRCTWVSFVHHDASQQFGFLVVTSFLPANLGVLEAMGARHWGHAPHAPPLGLS